MTSELPCTPDILADPVQRARDDCPIGDEETRLDDELHHVADLDQRVSRKIPALHGSLQQSTDVFGAVLDERPTDRVVTFGVTMDGGSQTANDRRAFDVEEIARLARPPSVRREERLRQPQLV